MFHALESPCASTFKGFKRVKWEIGVLLSTLLQSVLQVTIVYKM